MLTRLDTKPIAQSSQLFAGRAKIAPWWCQQNSEVVNSGLSALLAPPTLSNHTRGPSDCAKTL
jgi:hypothetical protein